MYPNYTVFYSGFKLELLALELRLSILEIRIVQGGELETEPRRATSVRGKFPDLICNIILI